MNAENFSEFLRKPAKLYQLTYQELKSLVVQYPYCQNLRYLMLKKCQLEGHRDFDRNLKLADTYLPDRTHLFRKMKEFAPEVEATTGPPIEVADDFLELRSLFELESDPQPEWLPIEPEEENPASEEAAIPKPPSEADLLDDLPFTEIDLGFVRPPVAADKDPGVQGSKDPTESFALPDELLADIAAIAGSIPLPKDPGIQGSKDPTEVFQLPDELLADIAAIAGSIPLPKDPGIQGSKDPTEVFQLPDELLADIAAIAGSIPLPKDPGIQGSKDPAKADTRPLKAKRKKSKPARSTSRPQPKPKSSFSSWLQQFQSPQVNLQLDYLMEASRQTGATTPGQTPEAERMAQESIQEHEEIATETLAFLLDKQGHTEKAIAMYERLCEMHPEKTERFRKKIQEITDRR